MGWELNLMSNCLDVVRSRFNFQPSVKRPALNQTEAVTRFPRWVIGLGVTKLSLHSRELFCSVLNEVASMKLVYAPTRMQKYSIYAIGTTATKWLEKLVSVSHRQVAHSLHPSGDPRSNSKASQLRAAITCVSCPGKVMTSATY